MFDNGEAWVKTIHPNMITTNERPSSLNQAAVKREVFVNKGKTFPSAWFALRPERRPPFPLFLWLALPGWLPPVMAQNVDFSAIRSPVVLYVLFHSPANGIGVKRSRDLQTWRDTALLTLGRKDWPWAQGRLTAGFVLDLRQDPAVGKALMFFHGSASPENSPRGGFDNFASLGLAWSNDLVHWEWPGNR